MKIKTFEKVLSGMALLAIVVLTTAFAPQAKPYVDPPIVIGHAKTVAIDSTDFGPTLSTVVTSTGRECVVLVDQRGTLAASASLWCSDKR